MLQRIECANCGATELLDPPESGLPARGSVEYQRWIEQAWPRGSSQITRLGFYIWDKPECESIWKRVREGQLLDGYSQSGYAHQLQMRQDGQRRKVNA